MGAYLGAAEGVANALRNSGARCSDAQLKAKILAGLRGDSRYDMMRVSLKRIAINTSLAEVCSALLSFEREDLGDLCQVNSIMSPPSTAPSLPRAIGGGHGGVGKASTSQFTTYVAGPREAKRNGTRFAHSPGDMVSRNSRDIRQDSPEIRASSPSEKIITSSGGGGGPRFVKHSEFRALFDKLDIIQNQNSSRSPTPGPQGDPRGMGARSRRRCWVCNSTAHLARRCPVLLEARDRARNVQNPNFRTPGTPDTTGDFRAPGITRDPQVPAGIPRRNAGISSGYPPRLAQISDYGNGGDGVLDSDFDLLWMLHDRSGSSTTVDDEIFQRLLLHAPKVGVSYVLLRDLDFEDLFRCALSRVPESCGEEVHVTLDNCFNIIGCMDTDLMDRRSRRERLGWGFPRVLGEAPRRHHGLAIISGPRAEAYHAFRPYIAGHFRYWGAHLRGPNPVFATPDPPSPRGPGTSPSSPTPDPTVLPGRPTPAAGDSWRARFLALLLRGVRTP